MLRTVNFQEGQIASEQDFDNLGKFPRESMDYTVRDLGGFTAPRYTGFLTEQTGASTVRVGVGRFYKPDGSVFIFDSEGGSTIDLLDHLPAVAKRIATIVVYGNTVDTDLEPREFLVDVTTSETEGREVAVENRRQAYIDKLLGQENATPSEPAVSSDYVAVAHVVLTPAGIESITQVTANRVISIRGVGERATALEAWRQQAGAQIDTLRTDISGLGSRLRDKADTSLIRSMALDLARVKDKADLPDDYASYGADLFVDDEESNTDAVGYNARVGDGLRFPAAATATAPLALLNAIENRVIVSNGMALPRWSPRTRLSVVGKDAEYPLTTTTIQNGVQLVERIETRTVRKVVGKELINWWELIHSPNYDSLQRIFIRDGETFSVEHAADVVSGFGYSFARLTKYSEETVDESYWDRVAVETEVAGSIAGQNLLVSQDGYLVAVNLFLAKIAAAGTIRVVVCETDVGGMPRLDAVLAQSVVEVADMQVYPAKTRVSVKPTFLVKGRRYAIVLISPGAHFVALVADNKFAQGTFVQMVDGAWQQGALDTDMALELEFAEFDNPIVEVQLAPFELAGGIDSIKINADATIPDGTALDFRVRVDGNWRSLSEAAAANILPTQPSLVQAKVVFVGTTDVMPALGVGAGRSAVTLTRPSSALKHISEPRLLPAPVDQVDVILRLEGWDAGEHTATITLGTGAGYTTIETADVVVDTAAPDDPKALIKKASFVLVAPIDAFTIIIDGSVGASGTYWHASERTDIEFNN